MSDALRSPIFDHKWDVEEQAGDNADQLDINQIIGPLGQEVEDARHRRLAIDHQVIAADGVVEEKDDYHVDIRNYYHSQHGFPRGAEPLNRCHVDAGREHRSMTDECLKVAEMREIVNSNIGGQKGL